MDMTENTYRKVSQDELEYERREARLKYQLQYNTEISVAREQGLAQGFAKGRSEGEAQKQREIAKNKIYPIKWTQQEEGFLENGHKKKG